MEREDEGRSGSERGIPGGGEGRGREEDSPYFKARKELEDRAKAELVRQEEFRKLQQEAVVASNAILADLSNALALER